MFNKKSTKLVAAMGLTLSAGVAQAAIVELTSNGGFETGDFTGWTQFLEGGTQLITSDNPSSGTYAGNLNVGTFTLIKQANMGIGQVTPDGQVINISFDMRGSVGVGGVVFAEFFSELGTEGTSKAEILFGGGPIFPNSDWTTYSTTATTGPDVSGGVTLQLKVDCGANANCVSDVYFDNVSVTADVSAVPVPAAVWLFGSGLLGLVGVARRKKALAA